MVSPKGKDILLCRENLFFSIDSIQPYNIKKGLFLLRILPQINTKTFYPFHTRTIRVKYTLLEKKYYEYKRKILPDLPDSNNIEFLNSIVQGGYYQIPMTQVPKNIFKDDMVFTEKNDIFKERFLDSPYKFPDEKKDSIIPSNQAANILKNNNKTSRSLFFYGLNVGQGDTLLIICPNKSVYLIDLNIYKGNWKNKIQEIQEILKKHKLDQNKIKALIITHEHLDHIRGISDIVNNFTIDYFIINHDYIHNTKAVDTLWRECCKIPTWINCNDSFDYYEGRVHFCYLNPILSENDNNALPDINDSSICICIKYKSKVIMLTGDASYNIINNRIKCNNSKNDLILKVSHHGSDTGTDINLFNNLKPNHSFISAGGNKYFNHPHRDTINILSCTNNTIHISKKIKKNAGYEINNRDIRYF